jgi:hypothetical protein
MAADYQLYKESLEHGFWKYFCKSECRGEVTRDMLDSKHGQGRLPVFKTEFADENILTNPDATDEEVNRLLSLIPEEKRHRWFRSMSSSQALALSLFGNLAIHGQIDWLGDIKDDEGLAAFGTSLLSASSFSMEHEVSCFNEPRPTSLDAAILGHYQVAIECKLTEREFGPCSMPRSKDMKKHCDGSYSVQGNRNKRCSLSEAGVRYWDFVPRLFTWLADENADKCPLRNNYQIVRNVLAACVREDGTISQASGHAVLIYDARNPAFRDGGRGAEAFLFTKKALFNKQNLRRVSWQKICGHMRRKGQLNWLTDDIKAKYGIEQTDN